MDPCKPWTWVSWMENGCHMPSLKQIRCIRDDLNHIWRVYYFQNAPKRELGHFIIGHFITGQFFTDTLPRGQFITRTLYHADTSSRKHFTTRPLNNYLVHFITRNPWNTKSRQLITYMISHYVVLCTQSGTEKWFSNIVQVLLVFQVSLASRVDPLKHIVEHLVPQLG